MFAEPVQCSWPLRMLSVTNIWGKIQLAKADIHYVIFQRPYIHLAKPYIGSEKAVNTIYSIYLLFRLSVSCAASFLSVVCLLSSCLSFTQKGTKVHLSHNPSVDYTACTVNDFLGL